MAYENVNINKLNNSLNSLENIKYNKNALKKVASSLNASNWSENSRLRIKTALEEIDSIYENIEQYIEDCKQAAMCIQEYKELDNQNKQYQSKVDINNKKMKNASEDDDTSDLEYKIFSYKNSIAANNAKKSNLKDKINNLIN